MHFARRLPNLLEATEYNFQVLYAAAICFAAAYGVLAGLVGSASFKSAGFSPGLPAAILALVGLSVLASWRTVTLRLDSNLGEVAVVSVWLYRKRRVLLQSASIRSVSMEKGRAFYTARLFLVLNDGQRITLMVRPGRVRGGPTFGTDPLEAAGKEIARFLGIPFQRG